MARVRGVIRVRNNLEVSEYYDPYLYEPYVENRYIHDYYWYRYSPGRTFTPDGAIREEIEDELWWSPFVNESDVKVSVEKGIATLTGTVDSFSEYNAATEEAYEGGAAWVYNKLKVD